MQKRDQRTYLANQEGKKVTINKAIIQNIKVNKQIKEIETLIVIRFFDISPACTLQLFVQT